MINWNAVRAAFVQQALDFVADPQWLIPSIITPFTFTMVTLVLFSAHDGPVVLYAVLGGGIMGMWGNTLRSSGWSISYDRMNGTLEPLMVTPTPLIEVIAGRAIWNALIGLVNAALVFIIAELVFRSGVRLNDPVLFFIALTLTLLSLSAIGLLLSAFFVFTRSSTVIMQVIELPIYVVSGAMIPLTMLPEWSWPISFALPPSWGVDALQLSGGITSTNPAGLGYLGDIAVLIALTAVFLLAALALFKRMDSKARTSGSLGRW
jgi:ABC-2 type transport system permease protein